MEKELIDFSTYDRQISESSSSEDEKEEKEEEENNANKYEKQHIMRVKPYSWDIRKENMPVKTDQGKWKEKNEVKEQEIINKNDEEEEDEDAFINDNEDDNEDENFVDDYDGDDDDDNQDIKIDELNDLLNFGSNIHNNDINMTDNNNNNNNNNKAEINVDHWKAQKKQRIISIKLEIADIADKILQDPYVNIDLLKLLLKLLYDRDIVLKQYVIFSLTRIIQDIMPPYRIGTLSQETKLRQENEQVRHFEQVLLSVYQRFLKYVFKWSRLFHAYTNKKTEKRDPSRFILARASAKCICLFLEKCSHFNFTKELIKNTIPLLNSPHEEIRKQCCDAMSTLINKEPINNVTVECIRLICSKIEGRNFNTYSEVIGIFLHLPLQHLESPDRPVDDEEEKEKSTKSKYEKKLEAKVSKDLKELDGIDKKKEFERQKVIIEAIFSIYFYILKLEEESLLLASALEGMAKFAHLVNVELVLDLISVISEKLEEDGNNGGDDNKKLTVASKLHCIKTAFSCLTGRGHSIEIDVKNHYTCLYQMLNGFAINDENWQHLDLLFETMGLMFLKSRFIPIERCAAFIKKLVNMAMFLPSNYCLACLHQARKLLKYDARLLNMLTNGGGYDQIYDPNVHDPDQCYALASTLWDLNLLNLHYHSIAKNYSRELTSWTDIPTGLALQKPSQFIDRYHYNDGSFRPSVKKSRRTQFSIKNNPPKSFDTIEAQSDIFNWFEFESSQTHQHHVDQFKTIKQDLLHSQSNQNNESNNNNNNNNVSITNQ